MKCSHVTEEAPHIPSPTERSRAAYAAVQAVLHEHGCRLVTTLHPEQVGEAPMSKILIGTSWGVMPLEQ